MDDKFKGFTVGVMIGFFLGAGVALLFAPNSGEENRKLVMEKYDELSQKVKELASEKTELIKNKTSDVIERAKKTVNEKKKELTERFKSAQNRHKPESLPEAE